jgi:putative ABC transport system substrate-binding protein
VPLKLKTSFSAVAVLLCCLASTLACMGQEAAAPDSVLRLGIAWQGESHMQDRTALGLAEVLEREAPQIQVEWHKELPSLANLDQAARHFQETKDAMILLRSTGATWLGDNPTTIPSFFGGCNNPVMLGAVPDLDQPGGMITGVTYILSHHDVLKAFKAVLPSMTTVLMIYQIDHPGGAIDRIGIREACEDLDIEFFEEGCRTHARRQDIIHRRRDSVSAIILINNGVVADFPAEAVAAAGDTPVLGYTRGIVEAGGLAALSADDEKLGRLLGHLVIKVLVEGKDPGSLRVRMDDQPMLHINMDTALRLKIQISQAVLKTADVIHDHEGPER